MPHFGLEHVAPYFLYAAAIVAFLLSVSGRPIAGLYYLVTMIPLQTVRYWLIGMPLGQSVVDILLLGVLIGALKQRRQLFPRTPMNGVLFFIIGYSYISLWIGSFYLKGDLPLWINNDRLVEWKDYASMPLLFFLIVASRCSAREIKRLVMLMCFAILLMNRSFHDTVAGRDFSEYSDDLRDEGSMGYAGVNGLAAFEAQAAAFLFSLSTLERQKLLKYAYLALAIFSVDCLMYSLSRAGYIAILMAWLFLGLARSRTLLVLLGLFLASWEGLVPNAVKERVFMTYDKNTGLERSGETRETLWQDAMHVFDSNPVVGTGFNTYAYMGRINMQSSNENGAYRDTHNYFIKVLVETGVVGLAAFLWMLLKAFWAGFKLFRSAADPFFASLGLALAAWVVAAIGANFFGDRWTYLQVSGYFWVLLAFTIRGFTIERERTVFKRKIILAKKAARRVEGKEPPAPLVAAHQFQ